MDKHVLSELIQDGLSTRQMAGALKVSQSTIKWWLAKHNLRTQYKKFKPHYCKHCGEMKPENFYGDRKECCKKCFLKLDAEISKEKKLKAIEHMGGHCARCGYNRYYGALDFHHIVRSEKEDWTSIRNWGWNRIVAELKKCVLLCANCHRETHGEEDGQTIRY